MQRIADMTTVGLISALFERYERQFHDKLAARATEVALESMLERASRASQRKEG